MREIIFRGKRTDNGEWEYGDLWCNPYGKRVVCIVSPINDQGTTGGNEVGPETVCQLTGLFDKNGRKIFEGDILGGFLDEDYPEHKTIVVVEFYENMWVTRQGKCHPDLIEEGDMDWFEVIGNIYDNPELLKGGADNG